MPQHVLLQTARLRKRRIAIGPIAIERLDTYMRLRVRL
jgi:hypothetical protein